MDALNCRKKMKWKNPPHGWIWNDTICEHTNICATLEKLSSKSYLCIDPRWIEAVIKESLPDIDSFEESLRDGIFLGKLAKTIDESLKGRKLFTVDFFAFRTQDTSKGLVYRHSDNINLFFSAMRHYEMPDVIVIIDCSYLFSN